MTDNVVHKSADQILEELFSTLAEPATTLTAKTSEPTSVPTNEESSAIKPDIAPPVPEVDINSTISEKKKKKKKDKDKKKAKKKKRKKGDQASDDEKRSREKEKKKKKDSSVSSSKETVIEPKIKSDLDIKRASKEPCKKETKVEVKPKVKEEAKKDAKPETKTKEEVKRQTKTDVKESVKSDRTSIEGDRRKRKVETKESRRSHPIPRRRDSRSRSPLVRRTVSRRSRTRSPPRRKRRPRSRSRSRSPSYHHRKRSRSPIVLKRPAPSPPKSPRIDKVQLLEFARQNLKRMQETGSLPAGVTLPNPPPEVVSTSTQSTGKTVAELTDYCKHLMADRSGEEDESSGRKESETTFTRHPFQIKPRTDTIVMNIRNAVALPIRKPEERVVAQAQLKHQFPVSSGQQHLELEWVPVPPPAPVTKETATKIPKVNNTATVVPTPRVSLPAAEAPSSDIGTIVAKRISSIRKLQENQFDVQARLELEEAESMTQSWATYHHTNPMTGEPMPELIDWSGAPQAWVRKDQFSNAAPLAGGVGMKLLQKMGWQPGEGLGRNKEGTLEPLSLDIKMDKKGLLSKEEMAPIRPTPAVKLIQDFQGKHPISILHELCTKKHWQPPVFQQVADIGPDHLKHFLFKVAVNGIEYQACLASTTKKEAKAQAAAACLQALGVFSQPTT